MLNKIFDPQNAFWQFVGKAPHVLALSVCWFVLCIPIVTIVPATIALYDAMIAELSSGEAEASLGYRAFWYATTGEMINYCEGYAISVSVNEPTVQNTRGLCQAVMKKIIDNLQAK